MKGGKAEQCPILSPELRGEESVSGGEMEYLSWAGAVLVSVSCVF